jgi:hypothetical protein
MASVVVKPVIIGIPVDDAKAIEPEFPVARDVIILSPELPAVRHIAAGADMGFIPVIKVYEAFCHESVHPFVDRLLVRGRLSRILCLYPFSRMNICSADKCSSLIFPILITAVCIGITNMVG